MDRDPAGRKTEDKGSQVYEGSKGKKQNSSRKQAQKEEPVQRGKWKEQRTITVHLGKKLVGFVLPALRSFVST